MPESHWIDRAMQEIEKFQSHRLVRKYVDEDLLRALDHERERLFHLCLEYQDLER